jgi:hypothetical protein
MKTILTTILLLSATYSYGQSRIFPDSNAIWSVQTAKFFGNGSSTMVNSVEYSNFYAIPDINLPVELFTLIRQDSIAQKVFWYDNLTTDQEYLLYDFSLNVNDTVTVQPISNFFSQPILVRIEAIDSVFIGFMRKRLEIKGVNENTGYLEYWIEGIGSTMGLFNPGATGRLIFDIIYPRLLCFEQDTQLVYQQPGIVVCYEDPSGGLSEAENNVFTVFPNPSDGEFYISMNNAVSDSYDVLIRDLSGRMIVNTNIRNYTHPTNHEVNLECLPSGVYLLSLGSNGNNEVHRLIKQ